ncbi:hypothetical protein BDF19DRAFT_432448 [Syncephalis fuscata]|nr:hypothetical protein BDF19DRAFT_432448 [Syncephalis fuscata]
MSSDWESSTAHTPLLSAIEKPVVSHGIIDMPSSAELEDATTASNSDQHLPLRRKLAQILETRKAHVIVLVLVVLDLVFVLIEILISLFERDDWEAHIAVKILSELSFAVVCLFAFEQLLNLYAFGLRYFASWLHMLDASREAASLIIILRFWRVLRVMDAVALTVEMKTEEKEKQLKAQILTLQTRLEAKEHECEDLHNQLLNCTCKTHKDSII